MDKATLKALIERAVGGKPNQMELKTASGNSKRAYIQAGTHKLRLVEYDYFDGTFDQKTGRGYSRKIGPLFVFEVVHSDSHAVGERVSRFFWQDASSPKQLQFIYGELQACVASLLTAKGAPVPDLETILYDLLPDVSGAEELLGAEVTCVAIASRQCDDKGNPFVNIAWQ